MDNKKNGIPKLRFPGFTGAWEQRRFKDISKLSQGLQIAISKRFTHPGDGKLFYITNEFLNPNSTVKYYIDSPTKNVIAEKTDILMTRTGNTGKVVTDVEGVYHNNFFKISYNSSKIDRWFLYYLLNSYPIQREILVRAGNSTIPDLNHNDFYGIKIYIPTIEEQIKIGTFLTKVDSLIALHQRKLEHLQEQKKGLLQKMFPKNGETVPEVRFPGFTDAWEQRKLGEITSHRSGTAIEKYFDENGEYKVISIGSYGLNSKYVDQNIRAKSNEITNERVVHAGELTMVLNDKTANGTIIGRSLLIENDNEYVINQRTEIITPKENFNNKFAYTLLNGPFRNKVRRIVQGGTQIYVNYSSVEKLTVFLPNIKEQEKIAEFFHDFDSLIALHQRKLEHLELMKKGLLQQMFV